MSATIIQLTTIPENAYQLITISEQEGYNFVRRWVDKWLSGENQFNQPGEMFFGAQINQSLIGVCGINQDPYIDTAGVGRLRHLYVAPEFRGLGIGHMLVSHCLASAKDDFRTIRLRTPNRSPHAFYNRIGFIEVDDPTATHILHTVSLV